MARRGKRRSTSRGKGSQSASALRRNGQRAFDRSDYAGAIAAWEQAAQRTSRERHKTRLAPALAEAYFRRGLNQLYGRTRAPEAGLFDLGEATSLQPGDPCYLYHLGLAAHRQGDLDRAIDAYRIARQDERFAARASYPLALALLARGEDVSDDPVWDELLAEERAMLGQAHAFRRRPYALSSAAPLLWQALARLDKGLQARRSGGVEQARSLLQQALAPGQEAASPLSGDRLEQGVAHYYLGVIAAYEGDWQEAGRRWSAAHAAGWTSPWLQANLAELYHRIAEERLSTGDAEGALDAAIEADRHISSNKRLDALFSHAYQRLAHDAVSAGDWEQALDYWEDASEVGGSSFRLAYNRALAYERLEDYVAAGELWREALRRRPRRADHPDAISDEQVAHLWRRAAEAYHKAGDFDEAVNVYRQALKWNPDDLDTRMVLAEGLIDDGRLQAAENELYRILERDPDNVPALLRVGEVIQEIDRWWDRYSAVRHWERVLELEPENAEARQNLVDFYRDEADNRLYWGEVPDAIKLYRQALDHQPESGRTLAALGRCHFFLGQKKKAHSFIDRALNNANGDLEVYGDVSRVQGRVRPGGQGRIDSLCLLSRPGRLLYRARL
jgi:tetratricopeptide (TPR) repeat protein